MGWIFKIVSSLSMSSAWAGIAGGGLSVLLLILHMASLGFLTAWRAQDSGLPVWRLAFSRVSRKEETARHVKD